jgi:hypothetical protein
MTELVVVLAAVCTVQANADQLQLVQGPELGSCPLLEGCPTYQMPLDDAIGPLHLTPVSGGITQRRRLHQADPDG